MIPVIYIKKVRIMNIVADFLEKHNKIDKALLVFD